MRAGTIQPVRFSIDSKRKEEEIILNNYKIIKSCKDIDFSQVWEILHFYGLSDLDIDTQENAFKSSYAVVFLMNGKKIIGVGRAVSDGITLAALCNIAVRDEYRGKGLGKVILDSLLEEVEGCNVILYTHPKHIGLYEHWGFSKLKTGYAIFNDEEHYRNERFIE